VRYGPRVDLEKRQCFLSEEGMIEWTDASFESSPSVAVIEQLACGVGRIRHKMHDLRGVAFLATKRLS
jgi:hypothetical protein